ncbi:hypothetical protein PQE66_gp189 [Bacillus phage PBC2]|uniref:Uncharacterized protein n=1 Tax=Bacillus phage PBC2 TaxID=1675029 RepID=A0A218KC85_9CAUD|nr:hypothetical protein PQE66_gp189 [Bacillus phage PBC2]AKQ08504.1 hypothetical protein PBC2_189 [Bacillus phage PBC2]
MNINQEKQYINTKMQEIEKEQARLADLHEGLKNCVDELTVLENKGITDITLSEYVAMQKSPAQPKPEVKVNKVEVKEKEKPVTKYPINGVRNKEFLDRDAVASTIISVLRTDGTPMHMKELYNKVNKKFNGKIGEMNFKNNLLPRIMKQTGQIERARTKGYYQYKSV